MTWTKAKTRTLIVATLTLSGCASQDTIIPPGERPMADIYREAMDEAQTPVVAIFSPEDICASLALEEADEDCQQKLEEHAKAAYRDIDTDPVDQPLDYIAYTRTTRSELDNLFPRHENPDLVIYVYPHLATRTRAPIPGYTTVLPLYDRIEYRLPGEALLVTPVPNSVSVPATEPPQASPKGGTP